MKPLFSILIASLFLFTACKTDDDLEQPATGETDNYINLKSPKVNQQNTYLRYTINCGITSTFSYSGDTLLLTVLETDSGFVLRENFTEGSSTLSEMDPASYPIKSTDDYILLPERGASWLFYFYGNDTIHLEPSNTIALQQQDCYLMYQNGDIFIGDEKGYVTNYSLGEISLTEKTAVSCVPIIMDLDAYLVYDETGIALSHSVSSSLMAPSEGFVWLKE